MPLARISLTLARYFSLSFITSGRSSGLHPVSSHSCCMYVRGGRPALAHPYVGVHRSTSLMSLSLLLQQCPACLVRLTWIVFVMGGRWPNHWCFVGCCCQDLFNIARNILVYIKYIWLVNLLLITFLNEPKFIILLTIKWFQVLLCITNNLIKHQSFVYTHLNDKTVLFSLSFVCIQFKCQTVLFDP